MGKHSATVFPVILALVLTPLSAAGQGEALLVTVAQVVNCGDVTFAASVSGGSGTYDLSWGFGDGETLAQAGISTFPVETTHTYPESGSYTWNLSATDSVDPALGGSAAGEVSLGPSVTLTSDVFPPLLTLVDGEASLNLTAEVTGGSAPHSYTWDLPGASATTADGTATATYSSGGTFPASVTVTDACGLSRTDTLTIVVVDPDDADQACHPMAQRIAEAVTTLFPDQATQPYTCADIFALFEGGEGESNLGFGRMWHAYQLARTMEDLTWEEILDWHLNGTGWGLLVQLDRFAETVGDVGLSDLVSMVVSGEHSVNDIRTAVRMASRFDADFEDALARLAEGASPGELQRLYRAAAELGMDPSQLDAYLEAGASLAEIQQAAHTADRWGADWASVLEAHQAGNSWGEIQQAFRLAGEDGDPTAILDMGIKEFHRQEREAERAEREAERAGRTAQQLAARYGLTAADVMAMYEGMCRGDWGCVRSTLREMYQGERRGPPEGKGH